VWLSPAIVSWQNFRCESESFILIVTYRQTLVSLQFLGWGNEMDSRPVDLTPVGFTGVFLILIRDPDGNIIEFVGPKL
jgi:catechol 2,3-dioxygenase-like lactoylglutathione lyase family enzyme